MWLESLDQEAVFPVEVVRVDAARKPNPEMIASLADLPDRYRLILCDIWGCVHDGIRAYPEASHLLARWRRDGRIVLLLTNAPRTAAAVRAQLDDFGVDRAAYDDVITSGDVGLAALRAEGRDRVGFIGNAVDRETMTAAGLTLLDEWEGDVVCTGFDETRRNSEDYRPALTAMRARGARLLVFNPDRIVLRGGVAEPCAGALGDIYEAMGGGVDWFGKPYPGVYQRCLVRAEQLAGHPIEGTEVLALGDGLATDYLGAAQAGFDFVFVTGGIEGKKVAAAGAERLLAEFMRERGLAAWPPRAIVPKLA
jgi:HAD superfamily hydrolase (TIGR01459 family)